jgi:hypothetical protein
MTTPPTFPANAGRVTLAYDFTPAGATFNPPITIRFSYDPTLIPAGVAASSLQIAYYDSTQSAWITLTTTSVDTTNHFIYAQITHFTPYAVTYGVKAVTPAPTTTTTTPTTTTITPHTTTTTTTTSTTTTTTTTPATFNVSQLTVSPANVNPGQKVTVSALAQNSGDVAGNYEVVLKIDGVITSTKILNLAAGTKDTVIFTVTPTAIREYSVDVNGLAGKFTVVASPVTSTAPKPAVKIPLWVIIGIGAGLLILAVIAIIVVGLRRKT